jgi:hypothetical protein
MLAIAALVLLSVLAGCKPQGSQSDRGIGSNEPVIEGYGPAAVETLGLSEFKVDRDNGARLKLFLAVLDKFGSSIKYPGVFRFELYEYVPQSTVAKGKRIQTWPDIDLTDAAVNNTQFQEYLKAYEFDLAINVPMQAGKTYVIESTCILPSGKRLGTEANVIYR